MRAGPSRPSRARRATRAGAALTALLVLLGLLATGSAQATGRAPVAPELLPVVFVHGNSGSAQQWESQFQRFASAGYSQELLFTYEYDTSVPSNDVAVAELGPYVDAVLARTGSAQVLLAAHSRGTTVSHTWLADPAHAAGQPRCLRHHPHCRRPP